MLTLVTCWDCAILEDIILNEGTNESEKAQLSL